MNNEAIRKFFDVILKGESKTYNDHNWYSGKKLKGYIQGSFGTPYSLLKKPLSEYTIGEVKKFQARGRDSIGQLWATGRYQIIPNTLKGAAKSGGFPDSAVYSPDIQDRMGYSLLMERKNLRKYLKGEVEDNKKNLQDASLDVAKIWSSVGVPYVVKGKYKTLQPNQSYYSGGGDRASVKTEDVQVALRNLRAAGGVSVSNTPISIESGSSGSGNVDSSITAREGEDEGSNKNIWLIVGIIVLIIGGVLGFIYRKKIINFIRVNY